MIYVDEWEDVADTEDTVKSHHPVKECFLGSFQSKIKKVAIGQDYQKVGKYRGCQRICLIANVQEQVFYYSKVNTFINAFLWYE